MGSVVNHIECPRCKGENCIDDFYYSSGEEYIWCPDCGYTHIMRYKKDDKGRYLKKDDTLQATFNNLIPEEILSETPFGVYRIEGILGHSESATLETEEEYLAFKADAEKLNREEVRSITISRLVNDRIQKEIIFETNKEEVV